MQGRCSSVVDVVASGAGESQSLLVVAAALPSCRYAQTAGVGRCRPSCTALVSTDGAINSSGIDAHVQVPLEVRREPLWRQSDPARRSDAVRIYSSSASFYVLPVYC